MVDNSPPEQPKSQPEVELQQEMTPDEHSDRSLLRLFRDGEQDAATALYVRYASRLIGLTKTQSSPTLASRVDPDDVVQSVFRTFFRRAADGCYDVPPGEELWQLLLVLALNKIRSLATYHRAQKRDAGSTVSAEELGELWQATSNTDETSLRVLEMTLKEVLQELPESHQQMIRLRIEGHTVQAISEQTERSKRSIERVLHGFRQRMAELVYDLVDDENEADGTQHEV
jgi:RNA polymerase sigma-70 factor (ECF subfamily)